MRRAFSLIELIVVITVSAALTGIAVSLLLVLFRAEQGGRAHVAQAESLEQLADQFRRDVHAAADVTVSEDAPPVWQFDLTRGGIAQFIAGADGVLRVERNRSKDVGRESYALPKTATATIAVDRATSPPVVSLTVEPKDASLRPGHTFRVEAVLGRDLRFTEQRKEAK